MLRMVCALLILIPLMPVLAAESLSQKVANRIIEEYSLDSASVTIAVVRSDISLTDVAGYDVKIIPLTKGELKGRVPMRLELYRAGVLAQSGTASVEIRRLGDLLVPTRNIRQGEALTPEMFASKRFDMTAWTEPVLVDPAHLLGCRARVGLVAGRQVPLARIEKIPDVDNGSTVIMVGSAGGLEIRAKGVALQNGAIGETIAVRNIDSRKTLTGKIVGPGTVEIAL